MASDVRTSPLLLGHQCFVVGDIAGAALAWREGANNTLSEGRLCAALLHVVAAEEACRRVDWDQAAAVLAQTLALIAKLDASKVSVDRDVLYDNLVAAWEALKTRTLTSLCASVSLVARQRVARTRSEVQCPHCFETSPVAAEFDEREGDVLHQDCPVCCRPWEVRVVGSALQRSYDVRCPERD